MALTTNFNYLQPTSFKIVIDRKNYPNLEYFCQNVTHPSMIMSATELPYKKITGIPFPGDKLTFGELSTNIILDEDMKAYQEMYDWQMRLLDTDNRTALSRNQGDIPSYSDITLHILTSANNTSKKIKYIDCIPTALGDVQFESTASGMEYIVFNASFRFTYFELI